MTRSPIVHIDALPLDGHEHGERFSAQFGEVGQATGMRQLGCMLTVVPPGKRAFPFHNHHALEEAFVILEGEGVYRYGEAEHAVRAGHVLSAPAGGRDTAHQLINTGSSPLKYLAFSTMQPVDVVEYPDSNKIGAVHWRGPDQAPLVRHRAFMGEPVDYWEGEE